MIYREAVPESFMLTFLCCTYGTGWYAASWCNHQTFRRIGPCWHGHYNLLQSFNETANSSQESFHRSKLPVSSNYIHDGC